MMNEENTDKIEERHPEPHENESRRRRLGAIIGVLALVMVLGLTAMLALRRRAGVSREAQDRSKVEKDGRTVEAFTVKTSDPERTLLLTGEARAYYSVTLYPRVSGYLTDLRADIGDVVKKGQVLAHIESPEQEQSYNSARADALNKGRIADRTRILRKRALISAQQDEQARSDSEVAQANLRTQSILRGYQDIVAPFDGVISNRLADPGSLMQNSSTSQAASQPLFMLSKVDQLRIFVYVDQKDAPFVRVGDPVQITVPGQVSQVPEAGKNQESGGGQLSAKVSMIAGELDPRTRTLLVELVVDNKEPERRIVPGSFIQVKLKIQAPRMLVVPVQALVMRENKAFVPVVTGDGKAHFAPIDLAQNDGENLMIRLGERSELKEGDRVALNLGNSVAEGQKLHIKEPPAAAGQAGQAEKSGKPTEEKPKAEK
jgi:membrane fusion protein (multidrug efflux system)